MNLFLTRYLGVACMNEKQNRRWRQQGFSSIFKAGNQSIHFNIGPQTTRDVRRWFTNMFLLILKACGRGRGEKWKGSCYIDDYNLRVPKLKLEQVLKNSSSTGPRLQYRLRPIEQCEPQVCLTINP